MRRWSLTGAWLLVLVMATVLTWQIVSAADDRVSDRPVAPLNVSAPVIATSDPANTTIPADTAPSTTATTLPTTEDTTTSTTTDTTPEVTTPTPTSSSTTAAASWMTKSIKTQGGTVVVSYRPSEVKLSTATPAPGFRVDVEHNGPPTVELEFESESMKVKVKAEWSDGDLKVETSASHDD